MWVALSAADTSEPGTTNAVGAGLADEFSTLKVIPIPHINIETHEDPASQPSPHPIADSSNQPETIATIKNKARRDIARLAGVPEAAVKLELRIEDI